MKKKLIIFILITVLAFSTCLYGCNNSEEDGTSSLTEDELKSEIYVTSFQSDAADYETASDSSGGDIVFSSSNVNASQCSVSGTTVTVTDAGDYNVSGSCTNGQIIINTKGVVQLLLNNLTLKCSSSAPIFVQNAEKVIITAVEGTENKFEDTSSYTLDTEGEPTATIFSKDELTINGSGKIIIDANYNNAVQCKDTLKIINTTLNITSTDDAVVGKDYAYFESCDITITSSGDGIRATNDTVTTDSEVGSVIIHSGNFALTCGTDAIQATNNLLIDDGTFTIKTGGGSTNSATSVSAKAIKGAANVTICAGTFTIDSSDDAIHSNATLLISGGKFTITSGDDGIHSDTSMLLKSTNITITKSYEGIESQSVTIESGDISITASDDGINIAGGVDSSAFGRPGSGTFSSGSSSNILNINGGKIFVNASGDGLDSNGSIAMTDGVIIVNGPTNNGNGSLDYDSGFTMTGGTLLAVGSSGMAQMPSSSSQYSVMIGLTSSATGVIHIVDEYGVAVLNFQAKKAYQNIVFCSPDLAKETYKLYLGGSLSGTSSYGIYPNDSTYTGGSLNQTFTISSTLTKVGSTSGGMGGGGRM